MLSDGLVCFSVLICVLNQLFSVRCANTTKTVLAVRISVDACHVQQYLLRPKREEGNEITCHGTGSHSMVFHLVSGMSADLFGVCMLRRYRSPDHS